MATNADNLARRSPVAPNWVVFIICCIATVHAEAWFTACVQTSTRVLHWFVVTQAAGIVGCLVGGWFVNRRAHSVPLAASVVGIILCGTTAVFITAIDVTAMTLTRTTDLTMCCLLKAAFALVLTLGSMTLWCFHPRDLICWLTALGNFVLMVLNLYLFTWLLFALDQV